MKVVQLTWYLSEKFNLNGSCLIFKNDVKNLTGSSCSTLAARPIQDLCPGLSLRAGGRGFSPATKRVAPGYFYWKIEEK